MPFLSVGGVTVEVTTGADVDEEHVEIGDFARAFDGTARSTVRSSYKTTWLGLRTVPMTTANADTLLAALKNATQPVACTGDLTGSVNAFPRNIHVRPVAIGTTHYEVVTFDLWEA